MGKPLATISGVALVPGVSKNGRLYTKENIGRAVERAQKRIADGAKPMTMRTHHAADDDSTLITARLTSITVDETGKARYSADLADTAAARDILTLIDTKNGEPFLRGVSIRGAWVGPVMGEKVGGREVETAADLELDGLDFTASPGVTGATVDTVTRGDDSDGTTETSDGRVLITESVEAALMTETTTPTPAAESAPADPKAPYGHVPYADQGYLQDGQKRWPLNTPARTSAAWSALNEAATAKQYTAPQLKRVKGRVAGALKRHDMTVATAETTGEQYLVERTGPVPTPVAEFWGYGDDDLDGSFMVELTNGPLRVTVSSWLIDPADLDEVGRAAMDSACQALAAISTNNDPPEDGAPTETAPAAAVTETDPADPPETPGTPEEPAQPADNPNGDTMPESNAADGTGQPANTSNDSAAPQNVTLSADQFNQLMSRLSPTPPPAQQAPAAGQPAEQAQAPAVQATPPAAAAAQQPVGAAAETAPTGGQVQETDDQRIARLVQEGIQAALPQALQTATQNGQGPARKGLVTGLAESTVNAANGATNSHGLPANWPDKPLHQYTEEENAQYVRPMTGQSVLGNNSGF